MSSWKPKGLFGEIINPPAASNSSLAPSSSYTDTKTRVKFDGSYI